MASSASVGHSGTILGKRKDVAEPVSTAREAKRTASINSEGSSPSKAPTQTISWHASPFKVEPIHCAPFQFASSSSTPSASISGDENARRKRNRANSYTQFRRLRSSQYVLKRSASTSTCRLQLETVADERVKKRKVGHHFFRSPLQFPFASTVVPALLAQHRPARASRLRPEEGVWVEGAGTDWTGSIRWETRDRLVRSRAGTRSYKGDKRSVLESWKRQLERIKACTLEPLDETLQLRNRFCRPNSFEPDDPRSVKEQLLAMLRTRSGEQGADSSKKFIKWVLWNAWVSRDEASSVFSVDESEVETPPPSSDFEVEPDVKCVSLDDPDALDPENGHDDQHTRTKSVIEPVVLVAPPSLTAEEEEEGQGERRIPSVLRPVLSTVGSAVASSRHSAGLSTSIVEQPESKLSSQHRFVVGRSQQQQQHRHRYQQEQHEQEQQQEHRASRQHRIERVIVCQG